MGLVSLLRKKCKLSLFTTPSHSQKYYILNKFRNFYKYDISETDFHEPERALRFSEQNAAKIYGTVSTKYLTNGSSSGVIAAILSCVNRGEKVLIWKNSHPCHHNAVFLSGAEAVYYDLPKDDIFGVPQETTIKILEERLMRNNIKAVIVTSPTYEGIVSDVKELKHLCEKYNAYLIVDEAHGALYPFSERLPQSSVNIADFTIQSLHKTAGGLNPTALLHSMCSLDVDAALKRINTTSPSYPLLASIEANINFLNSKRGKNAINELIDNIEMIREKCPNCLFGGDDITKILVKIGGLSGYELSEKLYDRYKIEDEKTNEKSSLLLCGVGTDEKKLIRLCKALKFLSKNN